MVIALAPIELEILKLKWHILWNPRNARSSFLEGPAVSMVVSATLLINFFITANYVPLQSFEADRLNLKILSVN